MAKINTKIGDVFSVKIDENNKKYFQLVAFDLTQLNSDVIRAFDKVYPLNTNLDLLEIVNGEIEFYAHCVTKIGLKMGYWESIGNITDTGSIENILFRDTNDYGSMPGEQIKISHNWYVWRINDNDFTILKNYTIHYCSNLIVISSSSMNIYKGLQKLTSIWEIRKALELNPYSSNTFPLPRV